jgi:hypothetical protein
MNPSIMRASQWLKAAPEETVVYQEQVRALIHGAPDRALTQIDGGRNLDDVVPGLDLHSVDGLRVVGKTIGAEQ